MRERTQIEIELQGKAELLGREDAQPYTHWDLIDSIRPDAEDAEFIWSLYDEIYRLQKLIIQIQEAQDKVADHIQHSIKLQDRIAEIKKDLDTVNHNLKIDSESLSELISE